MSYHERLPRVQEEKNFIFAQRLIRSAKRFTDRYAIKDALGLTESLDRDGLDLLVANTYIKRIIDKTNYRLQNPHWVGKKILTEVYTKAVGEHLELAKGSEQQLEGLINLYKAQYPPGSDRLHQIQLAVNYIIIQSEAKDVLRGKRKNRQFFIELAKDWKDRLAESS